MAGVQGHALAVAVSNAGGLGSLPCAMLSLDAMRAELTAIRTQTDKPFNVNFFCHAPTRPVPSERRAGGRPSRRITRSIGIDPDGIPAGPGRAPFSAEAADVLDEFRPAVVSFHFGLPSTGSAGAGESLGLEDPVVGDDGRRGALARGARRRRRSSRRVSRPAAIAACSCRRI